MSIAMLVRHAHTDAVDGRLSGRLPGVPLSPAGRRQAEALAERLATLPLDAVYSGPLERARDTAGLLAANRGLEVRISEALNEVDFGDWTGLSFQELETLPAWRRFNRVRSDMRIPGGEMMAEVQARAAAELHLLGRAHIGGIFAVVTHGDVIRAALCHVLGLPLDLGLRLEIGLGSMSAVAFEEGGPRVLRLNDTGLPSFGRPGQPDAPAGQAAQRREA